MVPASGVVRRCPVLSLPSRLVAPTVRGDSHPGESDGEALVAAQPTLPPRAGQGPPAPGHAVTRDTDRHFVACRLREQPGALLSGLLALAPGPVATA
jgi:hypothetical protein